MPLTIGVTPFAPWACLKPLLEQLGWQSTSEPGPLNADELDSKSSGPWVLLHARPEYAIASALDEGRDGERALKVWQSDAQRLLDFYKSNRRQAVMVDIWAAAQHPEQLVAWLRQNHSAFYQLAQPAKSDIQSPARPSEFNVLLATQWVAQSSSHLAPLLAQLEASSVPLADAHFEPPKPDLQSIARQLGQAPRSSQSADQNADVQGEINELSVKLQQSEDSEREIKDENDLLLKQLFQTQEELEKYFLALNEKERELTEGNDKLKGLQNQFKDSQHQNESLKSQLKTLEAQKVNLEKQLESERTETQTLLKRQQTQQKTIEELKGKISRGLRIENDKVLRQLVRVQEELAYHQSSNRTLRADMEALEVRNAQQAGELEKNQRALSNAEKENAELKEVVQVLRKSLQVEQAHKQKGLSFRKLAAPVLSFRRSHRQLKAQEKLVRDSGWFDSDWYMRKNPDVAAEFPNPIEHFVLHGGPEGRSPGPKFDAKKYLRNNPDVAEAGLNPLVHYLLHGKEEGRKI